jgi:hypothetical protein
MMLPQGVVTGVGPTGASFHQQRIQGNQAGSFAGAHMVTAGSQGNSGALDAARGAMQQLNTAQHQQVVAAQNFGDVIPDSEVRNAAKRLADAHKMSYVERGLIEMPHMAQVGRLLGSQG